MKTNGNPQDAYTAWALCILVPTLLCFTHVFLKELGVPIYFLNGIYAILIVMLLFKFLKDKMK